LNFVFWGILNCTPSKKEKDKVKQDYGGNALR